MNLKTKAFLTALGVIVGGAVAGMALVEIIRLIPAAWIPWIAISALIAVGFNVVYSITLAQLRYREKLQEMVDQK